MNRSHLRSVTALLLGAGSISGAAHAADAARRDDAAIDALSPVALYLQPGTIDTSLPRRDLAPFLEQEKGRLERRRFVIQLDGPMRPAWRERLANAGVVVNDYLPVNAFIARLEHADPRAVGQLEFIRWFDEYQDAWKLAPGVGARPLSTDERLALRAAGDALVIITLFAGEAADEIVAHLAGTGAQAHWIQEIGGNLCVSATLPAKQLAALGAFRSVQFVEDAPEPTLRNDTDRWIVQSNVPNSTPLYDEGLRGEGQILGLLDTRLDRNHCSFSDSQPIGPNHRKIVAYNSNFGSEFHGTHVGGTAVGDNNNTTATRGVAYQGKLAFNTIPAFNETDVQARLNTHHGQGARIHTNSWGDDGTTAYNSLCRGIDAFSYNNEEDLVLFAVTNQSVLRNPENAKNLVAVGASQDQPAQGNHCSGGVGPTTDSRRKPEIYAPGCSTNSASSGTSCGITQATGTSMACPAVAGAGMLVRQYFQEGFYPSGSRQASDAFTPSGALIKATLLNSANDMAGVAGYPSNLEGWGRVTIAESLFFESSARRLMAVDVRNADGLATGGLSEHPFVVTTAGERLKVTLVWTEPAASAGSSFASVNDLDLEVVGPGGVVYRGNVFNAGQSATGGARDDRNNVEQVHLAAPAPGEYQVRVIGTGVNQGTQGYALVATGDIEVPAPGVTIDLLGAVPTAVSPGEPIAFQLTVDPGLDALVEGSAQAHYRFGPGEFASLPLSLVEGTTYHVEIPPAYCGESLQVFFTAAGVETGERTLPSGGSAAPFAAAVGAPSVVFEDAMESANAWTVGAPGDAATRGVWARATPNAGPGVPPADHSEVGTACYITGQESNFGGQGNNDVDGGATTLTSPPFPLSSASSAVLSYWRWYSNSAGNAPQADTLVVEISSDNGATWSALETVGPVGEEAMGGWFGFRAVLETVTELTDGVRVRFIARDLDADSNIEAGVDDVRVDIVACNGPTRCPCDWDGDGVLNSQDFFAFVSAFFAGNGDFDRNGGTNSQDFFDFVGCFFGNCG